MQNNNNNSTLPPLPGDLAERTAYFEAEYEIVEACKKFMKDCEDISKTRVTNPWSSKSIKKYGNTYYKIYQDVKKYLNSLDEEEFHSPIRGVEIIVDKVAPCSEYPVDYHLNKTMQGDVVLDNWHLKIEKNLEIIEKDEVVQEIEDQKSKILNWKYDSLILNITDEELERKKLRWIERNIQLYSFLDVYKPEVFQNKYLMKHLTSLDFNFTNFTNYLHYICDLFLTKRYDSGSNVIPPEHRHAPAMIMLWIYHPFIVQARKYLAKNKKKIESFVKSKPENTVKITKTHISSLILASFIINAKVEELENIKKDYDAYFDKIMTASFRKFESDGILGRIGYRTLLTYFLANRIRPYRYTDITFTDLENFDVIIDGLDNKPRPPPEQTKVEQTKVEPDKEKKSSEEKKTSEPSKEKSKPTRPKSNEKSKPTFPTILENPDSSESEEETISSLISSGRIASVPLAPPRFIKKPKL